jgi:hypothetical protein
MTKDAEYWIAVDGFIGTIAGIEITIRAGFVAPSEHPYVREFGKFFVPLVQGAEQAIQNRRFEIDRAQAALQAKHNAELKAARIAQGDRADPSDDMIAEAAKRAARADRDVELVHDPITGLVTGAKTKAGYLMTS